MRPRSFYHNTNHFFAFKDSESVKFLKIGPLGAKLQLLKSAGQNGFPSGSLVGPEED